MKNTILFILGLLLSGKMNSQSGRPLVYELCRLQVNTVFMWSGEKGIDDWPLWSSDGKYIAINEAGRGWIKISLENVLLGKSDWLGHTIGQNDVETCDSLMPSDLDVIKSATRYDPREITTKDGIKVELKMEGFSVSLKVNNKTLWTTGGDNCHSLSLSADEKYVAFLSETNGLMLMDLRNSYKKEKLFPEVLLMNKAMNYEIEGNITKAEKEIDKALVVNPKYAEAWFGKSFILLSQENYSSAHSFLDSAIKKAPDNFNYIYFKAQVYFEQEKYVEALSYTEKYIAMRPECLYGYYFSGEICEKMGNRDEACKNYKLAKRYYSGRAKKKVKDYCSE